MTHQPPEPPAASRRLTALLVEPDPAARAVLADILESRFAVVVPAANLAEAREKALACQPDLAVVAARLPDGPVAGLLAAMRGGSPHVPVFLAGRPEEILAVLSIVALPGLRCLVRPFALKSLEEALDDAASDIVARRFAEEGWHLVRHLLDESPSPSAMLHGPEVGSLNQAFLRFMGLGSFGEFKARGLTLDQFLADSPPPEGLAAWACRLPDDALDRDHRLRLVRPDRPHSPPQVFQVGVTRLPGRNRCLLTLTDVTELELERRELLDLANRDPLTKALNQRKLDDVLAAETARSQRYATPLAVVMLDIDHFKAINDTYGHDVGDRVLMELVARLSAGLRQVDRLARFGGEEFVLVAPGIDAKGALEMAERLRKAVAETPFDAAGPVTASFGAAAYRPQDRPEDLLKRADEALYRAKAGGRNRVERESSPQTEAR